MRPVELLARREALGLSQAELAGCLAVGQATISRWEVGSRGISDGIGDELARLEDILDRLIEQTVDALDAAPSGMVLIAYGTDADLWRAHPDMDGIPAALHRVAMATAARTVEPAAAIVERP